MASRKTNPLHGWTFNVVFGVFFFVGSAWFYTVLKPPPRFKPPKDDRLDKYIRQHQGRPSIADGYVDLVTKADAFDDQKLRDYLRSLETKRDAAFEEAYKKGDLKRAYKNVIGLKLIPSSPGIAPILVPGDLKVDSVDWNTTREQIAFLRDGRQQVEITPDDLNRLKERRQKLLALGVTASPR